MGSWAYWEDTGRLLGILGEHWGYWEALGDTWGSLGGTGKLWERRWEVLGRQWGSTGHTGGILVPYWCYWFPGYVRVLLAAAAFVLMPREPGPAAACYLLSALLDAVDGLAARMLGQGGRGLGVGGAWKVGGASWEGRGLHGGLWVLP